MKKKYWHCCQSQRVAVITLRFYIKYLGFTGVTNSPHFFGDYIGKSNNTGGDDE